MTETTTAPAPGRQPWQQVAAAHRDDRTATGMRTWWAAYAQANLSAYSPWSVSSSTPEGQAEIRRQTDQFAYPGIAGFIAAASLAGWTPDQILDAVEDGGSMHEWIWQWLNEVGINPDAIAPAESHIIDPTMTRADNGQVTINWPDGVRGNVLVSATVLESLAQEINAARAGVLGEIVAERARQDAKWGEQNHSDGTGGPGSRHLADWARAVCKAKNPDTWWKILLEEVFEAGAESDPAKLREELVQVAAVATQWVEAIDRRAAAAEVRAG